LKGERCRAEGEHRTAVGIEVEELLALLGRHRLGLARRLRQHQAAREQRPAGAELPLLGALDLRALLDPHASQGDPDFPVRQLRRLAASRDGREPLVAEMKAPHQKAARIRFDVGWREQDGMDAVGAQPPREGPRRLDLREAADHRRPALGIAQPRPRLIQRAVQGLREPADHGLAGAGSVVDGDDVHGPTLPAA